MYRAAESQSEGARRPVEGLADLTLEHVEAELCELAAHIGAGMARWIALVDEYDRREGWGSWRGVASTAHWIAWRCACSQRMAREHVRAARALRELPLTRAAFSRGELSYSKVRTLTRGRAPQSEEFLLHQARYATASQLDRMLGAYRRGRAADEPEADEPELSWYWNRDGTLSVSARLSPEDGRAFLDALEAARSQIRDEDRETRDESGPAGPLLGDTATNADALSVIAESFRAHGAMKRAGPDRHQLIVHVDAEALSRHRPGRSELGPGPGIDPETARRLGCDASLRVLVKRGKRTLYLDRKTRTVSPALNLALRERDRGCRFPGCDNHRWVDAHHIVHWALGGPTDLDNLVLLCRRHHRLLHEGGFSVERLHDGELVFRNPRGERLANAPPLHRGSHRELRKRNRDAGLDVDSQTLLVGTGERMDLVACVDAVYDACAPIRGRTSAARRSTWRGSSPSGQKMTRSHPASA